MPRPATATLCLLLAGCAATEPGAATVFGGAAGGLAPTVAAAGEGDDGVLTEAELRAELATAADPTAAALGLARLLDREERLTEALAAIDAARRRRPDERALAVARAGVLRDLGRRVDAIAELQALRDRVGAAELHPRLLQELAEMSWLQGDATAAEAAIADMQREHALHEYVRGHSAELAEMSERLAAGLPPRTVRVRDLLGDVRGSASAARRHGAFTTLLGLGGAAADRAIVAILDDPEPELRKLGVERAHVPASSLAEFCAQALSDPAPVVRIAGAVRALELPTDEAAALLLPTLAAEDDAATFAELNEVLRRVAGSGSLWTAAAVADASTRAAIVAEWRSKWER